MLSCSSYSNSSQKINPGSLENNRTFSRKHHLNHSSSNFQGDINLDVCKTPTRRKIIGTSSLTCQKNSNPLNTSILSKRKTISTIKTLTTS